MCLCVVPSAQEPDGTTLCIGLPFLPKWRWGVTVEGGAAPRFRRACSSLSACWVQGGMGEAQGLPAPVACLGLPIPNLTTESGNPLNPKFQGAHPGALSHKAPEPELRGFSHRLPGRGPNFIPRDPKSTGLPGCWRFQVPGPRFCEGHWCQPRVRVREELGVGRPVGSPAPEG